MNSLVIFWGEHLLPSNFNSYALLTTEDGNGWGNFF
jgi:hypothetical protein